MSEGERYYEVWRMDNPSHMGWLYLSRKEKATWEEHAVKEKTGENDSRRRAFLFKRVSSAQRSRIGELSSENEKLKRRTERRRKPRTG